jgi:hypothetical protein
MAGWANYGYCVSHSRWFWGLRLYLICTPAGMPILWALADPKIGEREVLTAMLDVEPELVTARPGLILITDTTDIVKNHSSSPLAALARARA